MTGSERLLLSKREYYTVTSCATGNQYINEDGACFIFADKAAASSFADEYGLTVSETAAELPVEKYIMQSYEIGASSITVDESGKRTSIAITKRDISIRKYYNHQLNRDIMLLKETKKKKYLKDMAECAFIAPVMIGKRLRGQNPIIHYALAQTNTSMYMVLFSTLERFYDWKKANDSKNEYSPLETNLLKFESIRQDNNILVNPGTDTLGISNSQLSYIL